MHRDSIAQKYKEKYEQHRTLLDLLRNAGYADVQLHLLIFGSTGGMFKLTALHLKRLGASHSKVDSLLQDMHWKVLRRLEQIVGTRRRLEHGGNQGIRCRPLVNKRKWDINRVGLGVLDSMLGPTFSPDA